MTTNQLKKHEYLHNSRNYSDGFIRFCDMFYSYMDPVFRVFAKDNTLIDFCKYIINNFKRSSDLVPLKYINLFNDIASSYYIWINLDGRHITLSTLYDIKDYESWVSSINKRYGRLEYHDKYRFNELYKCPITDIGDMAEQLIELEEIGDEFEHTMLRFFHAYLHYAMKRYY